MAKLNFSKFGNKKLKCAGLGEVLFDVFEDGLIKLGGAPANFAYHCHQNGLDSIVISAVGCDDLGFKAREILASNFVPALLFNPSVATGMVHISIDPKGIPAYEFAQNTAYDHIPFNDLLKKVLVELDVVCFGSLAQRNDDSRNTIYKSLDIVKDHALRIFDINLRQDYYNIDLIEESLKRTDILKCNEDELDVLCNYAKVPCNDYKAYYDYLKTRDIHGFILTRGGSDSIVMINDEVSMINTPKVQVIDTVGAGDSFTATLISALLQGENLKYAHCKAVKVAAYVCTQKGAMPKIPLELLRL